MSYMIKLLLVLSPMICCPAPAAASDSTESDAGSDGEVSDGDFSEVTNTQATAYMRCQTCNGWCDDSGDEYCEDCLEINLHAPRRYASLFDMPTSYFSSFICSTIASISSSV